MKYIASSFLLLALLFTYFEAFGQYGYDYECIYSPHDIPCTDSTAPTCDDCHNDLSENAQDILQINCEAWMNEPICRDVPEDKKIDCQNLREQKPLITGTYTITHLNTSPFIDRFTVDLENNPPVRFEKINDPKRSIRSALDPPDFLDVARSCGEGVLTSIKNMAEFFAESITSKYNFATNEDYREETINQTLEYINGAKLYLQTEYQKAYENTPYWERLITPFQHQNKPIYMRMAWSIGTDILNKIGELIREEIEKTKCMKHEAQAETICVLLSDIFIPPTSAVALLKYGKSAIRMFANLQRAFPSLYKIGQAERILGRIDLTKKEKQGIIDYHKTGGERPQRSATPTERYNYRKNQRQAQARVLEEAGFDRIERSQIMLGRSLDGKIRQDIQQAHEVGRGELGRDGSPARIGNYTDIQLREKARILDESGLNRNERRLLVEAGIVGDNKIKSDLIKKFKDLNFKQHELETFIKTGITNNVRCTLYLEDSFHILLTVEIPIVVNSPVFHLASNSLGDK